MSKFKTLLKNLDYINDKKENNEMINLLKRPRKDIRYEAPVTKVAEADYIHQIDLMFLPSDDFVVNKKLETEELKKVNEYRKKEMKKTYTPLTNPKYRYVMIVVDIATGEIDAEPLKYKYSFIVKDALIRLYKRKILKLPHEIEVDAGSEFKDQFEKYFENKCTVRRKQSGRHRAQAVIESVNGIISKIIQTRMLGQELLTDQDSGEWVQDLPKIVKEYNKAFVHEPVDTNNAKDPAIRVKANTLSSKMLEEGTLVRVQLDNPVNSVDNKRLHGKFRVGDIRFSKEILPITQVYLRVNQPILYKVGDNSNVAYSRNQLQVVENNEVKPSTKVQRKFSIEEIIEKFKKKNRFYYKIKWSDGDITEQLVSEIKKEAPNTSKKFEESLKKKSS